MNERVIVVAPHPDDEVLGVGGTLLRRKKEGARISWLIATSITCEAGWTEEKVRSRADEVDRVRELFGFEEVFELEFPSAHLDRIPMADLVASIAEKFKSYEPEEVFVPHPSDAHSDHSIVFNAVASCTKWFRFPSVKRVLAYETLSETDIGIGVDECFRPNVFVDITEFLEGKLRALDIYASELGKFPFPRSREAIRSLAMTRGASSGFFAAEAFQLLRERQ
jgi:LmbE family N-acetylglucosaminyl deacetylase